MFAEGDGDGAGDGSGAGAEGNQNNNNEKPVSFDEFLNQGENRAEFDRRTQKAIQVAISNAKAKWEALADDKVSEAEKLAKMTKEEKAEYRARKLEKELNDMKKKTHCRKWKRRQERCFQKKKSASRMSSFLIWCQRRRKIQKHR